jgi:hypothetical protein
LDFGGFDNRTVFFNEHGIEQLLNPIIISWTQFTVAKVAETQLIIVGA